MRKVFQKKNNFKQNYENSQICDEKKEGEKIKLTLI